MSNPQFSHVNGLKKRWVVQLQSGVNTDDGQISEASVVPSACAVKTHENTSRAWWSDFLVVKRVHIDLWFISSAQLWCFYAPQMLSLLPGLGWGCHVSLIKKAFPNISRADVWYYMLKLTNTKDEWKKQKLWMNRGLSADCFSPSEPLPAHSSPALGFLAHFSFLLCLPSSPLPFCLSLPLGEKMPKKNWRDTVLLISRGLSRQRMGCLGFSSAVHGLLTVLWSWACVVKNRRKKPGRHTLMPQWRSWTGLRWGLSSKWGRWLVFNNWE